MALPLSDALILDLTSHLPGSLCTQTLADLGAEVIKIESPNSGDPFRVIPPFVGKTGSWFHMLNRNKKAMTLDVRKPRGREILRRLAGRADVLVENFRPGTMEEMGLGYEDLRGLNERIIYCSLTGFGQDGPYRRRPAHDINFLGISGILDLVGEKGGGPVIPAVQIAGAGGSLQAAVGILAALLRREKTGKGQHLDVAVLDSLTPFLSLVMAQYLADGKLPRRGEFIVGGGYACYNVYETKDGRYITLGCPEQKYWEYFCRTVGREDLIEAQFTPPPEQDAVIREVRAVFRRKTLAEWLTILDHHRTCVAPVNTLDETLEDPQVRERGLWFRARHPGDGEIPQQAFPIKCSEDQPGWRSHPPLHGEHTGEVLRKIGLSEEEILNLRSEGVI